jgi:hypothetical protein
MRLILIQQNHEEITMKRMLMLVTALLFSTYCFAEVNVSDLHSAIQNTFSTNSNASTNALSMMYSGKDISRPKVAVSDERSSTIQPKLMG